MRDYLHIENPTEEHRKKMVERASRISPAVAKYDVIISLLEMGVETKAELMAQELGMDIDQIKSGNITPSKEAPTQPPKQLMPLFRGGGEPIESVAMPVAGEPQEEEVMA